MAVTTPIPGLESRREMFKITTTAATKMWPGSTSMLDLFLFSRSKERNFRFADTKARRTMP